MDLDSLTKQAKKLVDERGGVDALKGDAEELKDIVEGRGSAMDKARGSSQIAIAASMNTNPSSHLRDSPGIATTPGKPLRTA